MTGTICRHSLGVMLWKRAWRKAQKHRQEAEALKEYTKETNNPELQKMAREKSHEERKLYTELKKSRWILLKKDDHLNERQKTHLLDILSEHRIWRFVMP